jgi:transcriptional regulator CtsR
MLIKIKKHQRAQQILLLLKKHGPLSCKSLLQMIEPKIAYKKLREALQRLQKRNLVDKRFDRLFGGKGVFYNLAQTDEALQDLSQYTGIPVDELKQPHFRHRELLHSECCSLWSHVLSKMFPEVQIIRDFEFQNSSTAERIMLSSAQDLELHPDLLLIFPKVTTHEEIAIAVEIERSPKTVRRLKHKLKKYANGTHVDGVIYLCDTNEIRNSIAKVYESKAMQQSKRIGHYSENFLLFGDALSVHTEQFVEMFNSRFKTVFLPSWVNYLQQTRFNSRRDSQTFTPAIEGRYENTEKEI